MTPSRRTVTVTGGSAWWCWVRRWRPGRSPVLGRRGRRRRRRSRPRAAWRCRPRPTMIAAATSAMMMRSDVVLVLADAHRHDGAGDQQRDQVHHLDQRVDGRAGGVLERVADGVADDRSPRGPASPCRRGRRPRPASWRCPRRHRSWPGRPPSGCRCRSRRPGSRPARPTPRPKPTAIGARTASRPGRDQLAQRVPGDDVDDLAVLRPAGALHDPGDLAELAAHLEDDRAGRPGRPR